MAVSAFCTTAAHKGVKVAGREHGNTGKFFRCPYHAWTYQLDGAVLAIPLKSGYTHSGLEGTEAAQGMAAVGAVQVYRDFVFCRLSRQGESFADFFGDALSTIDNMVDRSRGHAQADGGGVVCALRQPV